PISSLRNTCARSSSARSRAKGRWRSRGAAGPRSTRTGWSPSPDTLDAVAVAPRREIVRVSSHGFDWGDFGIGLGAGAGGLLALGAFATSVGRLRQPRHRLGNA